MELATLTFSLVFIFKLGKPHDLENSLYMKIGVAL
jgi:hypothetical protein